MKIRHKYWVEIGFCFYCYCSRSNWIWSFVTLSPKIGTICNIWRNLFSANIIKSQVGGPSGPLDFVLRALCNQNHWRQPLLVARWGAGCGERWSRLFVTDGEQEDRIQSMFFLNGWFYRLHIWTRRFSFLWSSGILMALITGQSEFYTDKKVWFYHLENKTLDFKVIIWNFLFLDALASLEEPIVTDVMTHWLTDWLTHWLTHWLTDFSSILSLWSHQIRHFENVWRY